MAEPQKDARVEFLNFYHSIYDGTSMDELLANLARISQNPYYHIYLMSSRFGDFYNAYIVADILHAIAHECGLAKPIHHHSIIAASDSDIFGGIGFLLNPGFEDGVNYQLPEPEKIETFKNRVAQIFGGEVIDKNWLPHFPPQMGQGLKAVPARIIAIKGDDISVSQALENFINHPDAKKLLKIFAEAASEYRLYPQLKFHMLSYLPPEEAQKSSHDKCSYQKSVDETSGITIHQIVLSDKVKAELKQKALELCQKTKQHRIAVKAAQVDYIANDQLERLNHEMQQILTRQATRFPLMEKLLDVVTVWRGANSNAAKRRKDFNRFKFIFKEHARIAQANITGQNTELEKARAELQQLEKSEIADIFYQPGTSVLVPDYNILYNIIAKGLADDLGEAAPNLAELVYNTAVLPTEALKISGLPVGKNMRQSIWEEISSMVAIYKKEAVRNYPPVAEFVTLSIFGQSGLVADTHLDDNGTLAVSDVWANPLQLGNAKAQASSQGKKPFDMHLDGAMLVHPSDILCLFASYGNKTASTVLANAAKAYAELTPRQQLIVLSPVFKHNSGATSIAKDFSLVRPAIEIFTDRLKDGAAVNVVKFRGNFAEGRTEVLTSAAFPDQAENTAAWHSLREKLLKYSVAFETTSGDAIFIDGPHGRNPNGKEQVGYRELGRINASRRELAIKRADTYAAHASAEKAAAEAMKR